MKIVIYTAIFNDYDFLSTPKVINRDVRYVCFSDKKINAYPWENIVVEREFEDLRLENRKYKILCHKFFPDYDYSIYLDASYAILRDISQFVEVWLGENDIAVQKHRIRNCLYDEALQCIRNKKENSAIIKEQIKKYMKEGYPRNNGLTQNGFLIRRHTKKVIDFNEAWWNEVKTYSTRDQISFSYVIYKLKMKYSIIPIPSQTIPNSEYLEFRAHNDELQESYILQKISDAINAHNYLEIGLTNIQTFIKFKAQKKFAVFKIAFKDIFNKNIFSVINQIPTLVYYWFKNKSNLNNRYFFLTKNTFFFKRKGNSLKKNHFDLIFIDKKTNFREALQDVLCALNYLHNDGVIVLNGCLPINDKSSNYIKNKYQFPIKSNIIKSTDIWKVVAYLRSFRNDINVFVLNIKDGIGIITKEKPESHLGLKKGEFLELTTQKIMDQKDNILNLKSMQYFNDFLLKLSVNKY